MNSAPDTEKKVEIFKSPVDLRRKCKPLRGKAAEVDPVARAEQELSRLAVRFDTWMEDETVALEAAFAAFSAARDDAAKVDALFRSAHDLRGQSETFGYPLAGRVAANLSHLLENASDPTLIPLPVIEHHVQAIRAIVREKAKDAQNRIGTELAARLGEVVEDLLRKIGTKPDA